MEGLSQQGAAFTELLLEVFRINGLLLAAGDTITRPVGLTSARWQVLGVVEHGPSPVAHVARTMGLTRQGVQGTADALEKDGFIDYVANPHHRRAKLMRITPKGEKALEVVRARQAVWANEVAGKVDLDALQGALEVLRELRGGLEQTRSSQKP